MRRPGWEGARKGERLIRSRGPLADSYPAAAALVVFALVPFLMLTAAVFPLFPLLSKSLGLSTGALDITLGMSDAAYAFGTVMAVQLAVHVPGRRMLLGYITAFVLASILAAWAPVGAVFIGAFITQGLCTSLMLIAAVPPLVTGWPPAKMPWTGGIMNLCIFGAVAAGPTVGAIQASSGHWRPLFWGVVALGVLALAFALLTFEDQPPQDRSAPWDFVAITLAGCGCGASFFGASQLRVSGPGRPLTLTPLLAGVGMIIALVIHQYRSKHPLMPVKQLATAFPITGIIIALSASSAAFALMELVLLTLQGKASPVSIAVQFLPEFGAAVVTAVLFGALFRTRFTPVLAISGLAVLSAAAALLTGLADGGGAVVMAGSALIGFGVGASVSPALFLAGFSLRSSQIQRVFALIELLRGVTAFLVAPILLYLATVIGSSKAAGIQGATWICLGIAVLGGIAAIAVFRLSGGRLQTPDLERWSGGEPAWRSAPLGSSRISQESTSGKSPAVMNEDTPAQSRSR